MPPETTYYHPPSLTPKTPLLSRVDPKSRLRRILHQNRKMKIAKNRIIPALVFILCIASVFRFLNLSIFANFSVSIPSAAFPSIRHHDCSSSPTMCRKNNTSSSSSKPPLKGRSTLTKKETRFISNLLSHRVPCNLLVFGNSDQYSRIKNLNTGGVTLFLEDYLEETRPVDNSRVHKITYNTVASEAYQHLRDARENPDCLPKPRLPKSSKCSLALPNLPKEVFDTMWDFVIVDGPRGSTPSSPGRMASIYTASILARRGRGKNITHVIVHDVDRMIEKWYSWEFLCEENLVSSKARFWHFQIVGVDNATKFCTS